MKIENYLTKTEKILGLKATDFLAIATVLMFSYAFLVEISGKAIFLIVAAVWFALYRTNKSGRPDFLSSMLVWLKMPERFKISEDREKVEIHDEHK